MVTVHSFARNIPSRIQMSIVSRDKESIFECRRRDESHLQLYGCITAEIADRDEGKCPPFHVMYMELPRKHRFSADLERSYWTKGSNFVTNANLTRSSELIPFEDLLINLWGFVRN